MKKRYKYYLLGLIFIAFIYAFVYYFFYMNDKVEKNASNSQTNTDTMSSNDKNQDKITKVSEFQIPILMYHYIRDASGEDELGKGLSVHPDNLDKQMNWLKENDYEAVKLADLADEELQAVSKIYAKKKKPVIITFDDGYLDAYTQAFPVLKKYALTGTFFVIRSSVGKDDSFYMNQAQIDELASANMEIGSHTLSHPDLTKISIDDARTQIEESKQNAEVFCYPAGRFNDEIAKLVEELGYKAAVTTNFGYASIESDLFKLRRVRIEDTSTQAFADKISAALESKF